jgi:hypothetical protein
MSVLLTGAASLKSCRCLGQRQSRTHSVTLTGNLRGHLRNLVLHAIAISVHWSILAGGALTGKYVGLFNEGGSLKTVHLNLSCFLFGKLSRSRY